MEDKWTFLREAEKLGLPISPFMDIPEIVIKDKNEEGGMGISVRAQIYRENSVSCPIRQVLTFHVLQFFRNAVIGGDWIIQEALHNDEFVASLLPEKAPLSTFRVIT
jgi:hypothetical protein